MNDVVFRSLSLAGFGLYRDPVTLVLDPAFSVLVGGNETGKSTLVNGVLATLFGLRREADPAGFTTARFKNWDSPAEFWGEVQFSSSGLSYRLRREFDTHEVVLVRGDGKGWTEEFRGNANPQGRSPDLDRYHNLLKRLLGVADRQVFESVFCVTQDAGLDVGSGLPGPVQELVAGSGDRSLGEVVGRLVESFRAVSRRSGEHGIALPGVEARDGRNDQALELVEAEITDLRTKIESSSATLADLAARKQDLARKEEDFARMRGERDSVKDALEVWGRWETLRRDLRNGETEQARLERVITSCGDLLRRVEEVRASLARDFAEFKDVPEGLEVRLEQAVSSLEREASARRELGALESEVRASLGDGVLERHKPGQLLQELDRQAELEADLRIKGEELQGLDIEFAEMYERRRRRTLTLGMAGLAAGLVAGVALRLDPTAVWVLTLAVGLAAGAAAFLWLRPKPAMPESFSRYQALRPEVEALLAQVAEGNESLGMLASADPGEVGALREKLRRMLAVVEEGEKVAGENARSSTELRRFLDRADGDPARVRERLSKFRPLERALRENELQLAMLLKHEEAGSPEDLSLRKTSVENKVQALLREEQALRAAHPYLERVSREEDAVELAKQNTRLKGDLEGRTRALDAAEKEIHRLRGEVSSLEGIDLVDVASEEICLADLEADRDRLALDRDALALAYRVTNDGIARFRSGHRERLGASVQEWFVRLTGRGGRRVELDGQFSPRITEAGGQPCHTAQLSHGAQDQLALAVRLAVADLVGGDARLPLLFDDPFLTFDAERLDVLRQALGEIARSRQVILLTHREDLRGWGERVAIAKGRMGEWVEGR
jgi:DNA repair exonuclease SbcCD ATPase subunit